MVAKCNTSDKMTICKVEGVENGITATERIKQSVRIGGNLPINRGEETANGTEKSCQR